MAGAQRLADLLEQDGTSCGQDEIEAGGTELLELDADIRFEDVADRVGVSRTTLYYYFSGREDLVGFLLAEHLVEGGRVVAEAISEPTQPVADRLRDLLTAMIAFLSAKPGMCAALLTTMASGSGVVEVMLANQQHVAGPLHQLLVEGQQKGEFDFAEAADATDAVMGALLITVLGRASRGESTDPESFGPPLVEQLVTGVYSKI